MRAGVFGYNETMNDLLNVVASNNRQTRRFERQRGASIVVNAGQEHTAVSSGGIASVPITISSDLCYIAEYKFKLAFGPGGSGGSTAGPQGPPGINGQDGAQGPPGIDGFSPTINFQRNGNNMEATVINKAGTSTVVSPYPGFSKLAEAVGNGTSNEMSVTFPNNGRDFTVVKIYLQPRVTASVNEIYLKVNNKSTNSYSFRITNLTANSTNNSTLYRNQNKITLAYLSDWWIGGELMEITVSIRKEGGTTCKVHSISQNTVGVLDDLDIKQTLVTGVYYNQQDTSPTTTITVGIGPSATAKWHEKARMTAYAINL